MAKDEFFERIWQATKDLDSVRKPLPKEMSQERVFTEMTKARGFLQDQATLNNFSGYSGGLESLLGTIVTVQVLCFNRDVDQMTAESLAEAALIGFRTFTSSPEELAELANATKFFCAYLEKAHLAASGLTADYEKRVQELQPDVAAFMNQPTYADNDDFYNHIFANDPVMLLPVNQDDMFAQDQNLFGIDFNEFLAQVAKKHNPVQLQLAYVLFLTGFPIYSILLTWGERLSTTTKSLTEDEYRLHIGTLWSFADRLTTAGIVALSMVIHQFLKFCLDKGKIDARAYALLLKASNRGVIRSVVMSDGLHFQREEWRQKSQESIQLADAIFTKPNYTIDVAKAVAQLEALNWQPVGMAADALTRLTLKNPLSARIIARDRAGAQDRLTEINQVLASTVATADLTVYSEAVLQLHTIMTQTLHRQKRQWTKDSLYAALLQLFQTNRELDSRPTFLRYFQIYLLETDRADAIKDLVALNRALARSSDFYVTTSANALAAKD
ncbi:hypothetical protein [Levilactobacillus cerevisiae]|uniref:hypothetical protein n=1 Tax=Levilactobacillus cerevisiae TaxID=1704076 RepID=UPI000F7B7CEB|nr:hypothetical protein [Levilactobacillus cerevisiae]